MAENGASAISRVSTSPSPSPSQQSSTSTTRPAITLSLPPRTPMENIFAGFSTTASGAFGASPGPLSLVSSFFSDYSPGIGSRSFSQLLAGAMSSPAAIGSFGGVSDSIAGSVNEDRGIKKEVKGDVVKVSEKCEIVDLGFKQNRPMNLAVARSPLFTIPPGLSPPGFLNSPGLFSPGLFSPGQDLFAMSHQEALAQVTAQAALSQSQSQMHMSSGYHSSSLTAPAEPLKDNPSSTTNEIKDQHMPLMGYDPKNINIESPDIPSSDNKPVNLYQDLDKPVDDGYHWRKYGQKQVKGGEYPRSYYKCSHHTCPVKKKVERSVEGQISEITYKGQHNHELPPPSKRAKDGGGANVNPQSKSKGSISAGTESLNKSNVANVTTFAQPAIIKEQVVSQATSAQLESSDIEEIVTHETRKNTGNSSMEPSPKRRNIEAGAAKVAASHKTVTEQRIIVQTRSEVDLLDDGFRWRKYGQKVVKGNPHPRSYYKCTTNGCNVRKHVERASTDVKAVITTYEGKHTHDPPTGRNYNSNKTNTNQRQLKPHKVFTEVHDPIAGTDFSSNHTNPVAVLQLKEEQIRV